jgi:uncharacterized membrane protein
MRIAWWMMGAALAAGCSGSTDGGSGTSGTCPDDLPSSCPADVASYQTTVAPILAAKCVACHGPGGQSVHYLQTYAEVQSLAGSTLDQVYACKMPPVGYTQLTATERTELMGWLVCSAPDN